MFLTILQVAFVSCVRLFNLLDWPISKLEGFFGITDIINGGFCYVMLWLLVLVTGPMYLGCTQSDS